MREVILENHLVGLARAQGGDAVKLGVSGWPDRVLLLPEGRVGLLELKAPGEVPGPLQLRRLEWLRQRGHLADWADSYGRVAEFVAALLAQRARER